MIILKELIENLQIEEGLIRTHSLEDALSVLNYWCSWNDKIKYDIIDGKKIKATISNQLTLNEYDLFSKYLKNVGYFPSHIYDIQKNIGEKYTESKVVELIKNNIPFILKLEANYDKPTKDQIGILYHITHLRKKDKILKIGLCPKSDEKIAHHPARVYFTFQKEDAYLYAYDKRSGISEYVLFEVDLSKLKDISVQLYKDPNFPKGCYTNDNIPKNCLKIIDVGSCHQ
jgi:hypothetical protein